MKGKSKNKEKKQKVKSWRSKNNDSSMCAGWLTNKTNFFFYVCLKRLTWAAMLSSPVLWFEGLSRSPCYVFLRQQFQLLPKDILKQLDESSYKWELLFGITVMYCGGSSKLVEPSTTSLLKLLVNLWQTRSCQSNQQKKEEILIKRK